MYLQESSMQNQFCVNITLKLVVKIQCATSNHELIYPFGNKMTDKCVQRMYWMKIIFLLEFFLKGIKGKGGVGVSKPYFKVLQSIKLTKCQ